MLSRCVMAPRQQAAGRNLKQLSGTAATLFFERRGQCVSSKKNGYLMLTSQLNPDGTALLSIGAESVTLNAHELDQQLLHLARLRSQMAERVPEQPPAVESVVFNPAYAIRTDNLTKASLLRLRHEGFGWLNFELPSQEVVNMKKAWTSIVYKLALDVASGAYEGPERRMH
jgi:hypothetical protein